VFGYPSDYGTLDVLLGIYGYAAQIYCDFSAYSDIAIGVALLLGMHFPDNFNAPYFATSFREFWQRWHISLSTWLRDYLYIPLGGSRCGAWRTRRNLLITFLLGGLWHGAQWRFVVWGALHGIYLSLERGYSRWIRSDESHAPGWLQARLRRWAAIMVVFHGVCLSWFFFRAETFEDAWTLIRNIGVWQSSEHFGLGALILLAGGFAIQLTDGSRLRPVWNWFNRRSFLMQGLVAALIITIILGLGPQGVAPFIYFQF
jgi:D-alanyl-lipoteichoic acid acyltransferase DltB (MBOAT superfamily)